jgi:hypothetical protein
MQASFDEKATKTSTSCGMRAALRALCLAAGLICNHECFSGMHYLHLVFVGPPPAWDGNVERALRARRYVCLKERNMLLTLQHDAMANKRKMDGEERFKEVRMCMAPGRCHGDRSGGNAAISIGGYCGQGAVGR